MSQIIHIKSVPHLHQLLQINAPSHPLISIVRHTKDMNLEFGDVTFNSDLYFISLKENIKGHLKYGRNNYDFNQGTLVFIAPGQITSTNNEVEPDLGGWSIFFHPDLIRSSSLGKTIANYNFFNYDTHEALHLSKHERECLTECVTKIDKEIRDNFDSHSQDLIIQNIETILKYGLRYYERQFMSRTAQNRDKISDFELFLKQYVNESLQDNGTPSMEFCGQAMNMSGKYLSDLLKAETGKSLLEHIHSALIDKAKTALVGSDLPIGEIAHTLGFNYPQHFSKMFKSKTGVSPKAYRKLNTKHSY